MFKKLISLFNKQKEAEVPTGFVCSCCGETMNGWPAIVYPSPLHYNILNDEDKEQKVELTSDTCIIRHKEQTDYFARVVLFQKIIGTEEILDYGIWVSLSPESFKDFIENFDNTEREGGYFGWLSNNIFGYENTSPIPMDVYVQKNGNRPIVIPHQSYDHPFVHDYYNGITMKEAHRRIKALLSNT